MTHKLIQSKMLRRCYAAELYHMRELLRSLTPDERWAMLFGVETAYWGLQKRFAEVGL